MLLQKFGNPCYWGFGFLLFQKAIEEVPSCFPENYYRSLQIASTIITDANFLMSLIRCSRLLFAMPRKNHVNMNMLLLMQIRVNFQTFVSGSADEA